MSSSLNTEIYQKKELPAGLNKLGIILFAIGLVLVIAAYLIDSTRSAFDNVIFLMFMTSVGLGSLFLICIEYLGGAVWSTPFRRIAEFFGSVLFLLPLIAIPAYMNLHGLYHWSHPEVAATDEVIKVKSSYLNPVSFGIRTLIFYAIWIFFYAVIKRNSSKQDVTKDQKLTSINIKFSAIFMPIFAISITLSAIDWLMSLEPHWFSTMFGVYYFSGSVLAGLAIVTLVVVLLQEKGYFGSWMNDDHYYSFGALLFAFTNFWAYIGFSQFLLIWYANLPEETAWFMHRSEGSWLIISIALIFARFIVPYFALLSQPSKKNPKVLKFVSIWILCAHILDLYWIVMPVFSKDGFILGWQEFGFPILAVGLLILIFSYKAKRENLIPIGDPKLKRGVDFTL